MNRFELEGSGTKNILILTGVHGNEITPVYCGYLLINEYGFTHNKFKKITILNALNTDGIKKNTREIPSDGTNDLNRMFKVEQDEDITTEDLEKLFNENDVIIDIHSSPRCTEFTLINQDEYANSYVRFCRKHEIKYLLRYSDANTIKKYGLDKIKISFTIEINGLNYIDFESAKNGVQLVYKIVDNCDKFELSKEIPKYTEYFELFTYKSGLFLPYYSVGDEIKEGNLLGKIIDLTTMEESVIPYNRGLGWIICTGETQYVSPSQSIYFIQPID